MTGKALRMTGKALRMAGKALRMTGAKRKAHIDKPGWNMLQF